MRRTLASPNLAISSNRPAAIRGDVLSASIRTAKRRRRLSSAMCSAPRRSRRRFGEDRVDMNIGAIDQWEGWVAAREGQEEIGTAQHDRFYAVVANELTARGQEDLALL